MHLHWIRFGAAVVIGLLAVSTPAGRLRAQDQQQTAASDLADALQRFGPTLDAIDGYEKLLKGVEALRSASPCAADAAAQSLGETLVWSADAGLLATRDLARGKSAIDSCRLGIATDALDGLTQQSAEVAQLVRVFSVLPPSAEPSPALDQAFEQTRWIVQLRADAVEITDLARQLETARAADPSHEIRLAQAKRLIEIAGSADEVLREVLSCRAKSQPAAAVTRIVATIQPISAAHAELDAALTTSKETTCAASVAAAAVPPPPAGPSWLPAPANTAPKQAAAAVPSWVPTKDAQPTQTSTTRAADMVGEVKDRLLAEETQRIEEQSRRYADARAQRAADTQRLASMPAASATTVATAAGASGAAVPAVLSAPLDRTQALALAQRHVAQQQQQRQTRKTSFLGVLGRVTGVIGAIAATAATGGLAAPALTAALPALGAVSAISSAMSGGGAAGLMGATSVLPLPPAAAQALAAVRAGTAAATGQQLGTHQGMPQMVPAPGMQQMAPSPGMQIPNGQPTGYLPPTAAEPFLGPWRCTATNTAIDRAGQRSTTTAPLMMTISQTQTGLTLSTETGAVGGTVVGGRAQFNHVLPIENGSCQLQISLLPQGGSMSGNTNVTCPTGEQIVGSLVCQR